MDFTRTEAAQDLSGLVRTIVDAVCTPEHQRALDGLDQRFDTELWRTLIDADILSTAAPESVGGGGFGTLEQAAILAALGRQLAAVPYLESVVLGAGVLARFGSAELQQQWAAPAVAGEKIVTIALDGEWGQGPVQATGAGDGSGSPAPASRYRSPRSPTPSWFRPKPIRAQGCSWSPPPTLESRSQHS